MAGVAQFSESVLLLLAASNKLMSANAGYLPLEEWDSVGELGGLLPKGFLPNFEVNYNQYSLAQATEGDFEVFWALIEYTLKFQRGHTTIEEERAAFRHEGQLLWTSSSPPSDGLPFNEADLRSNMNMVNIFVTTKTHVFFVLVNQMFTVISDSEPTNHLHSIYIAKDLMTEDRACLKPSDKAPGGLCDPSAIDHGQHLH